MTLPDDYLERVYAGVLGKLIGVYLGRPFENWTYARIMAELGEITYYVNDKLNQQLVVTDDDVTGTFTFLRALDDYPFGIFLTPEQVGDTWLNYIIEKLSILWWGGMGNSTEHTAFLRLKHGIMPPHSGSMSLNGKTVAEQIGAQIFIDGWGMISPGDPEQAADFARNAASVSHDGEAIYGAQVIAALEAQAFVEPDLNRLLDMAVSLIPHDSVIYRLITDMREWRVTCSDWRTAREKIVTYYGYDKFGGNCHIVPNHALIHLGLLYGDDDFQKSLMITNTSGWDTDCNSGNVGCIMGIKNGLAGIDHGPDWRSPIADRLFLPTADSGRCITDAVQESVRIVNIARRFQGIDLLSPKKGARFHFEIPGSVQGFESNSPDLMIENSVGYSTQGKRSLGLRYHHLATGRIVRASTPTFIRPEDLNMVGYNLHASPTLYPGQTIRARVTADLDNTVPVQISLFLSVYGAGDQSQDIPGPAAILLPGKAHEFQWVVGDTDSQPIHSVGLQLDSENAAPGTVYLDYLTWDGTPNTTFTRPTRASTLWQRAWACAVDMFGARWPEPFRPVQNEGRGLLIQGTREWMSYRVEADIKPLLFKLGGIAAYVQGLKRYYALLLAPGNKLRLIKLINKEQVLAETDFAWDLEQTYELALEIQNDHIRASVNGQLFFDVNDPGSPLQSGAVALLVEDGCLATHAVTVKPL